MMLMIYTMSNFISEKQKLVSVYPNINFILRGLFNQCIFLGGAKMPLYLTPKSKSWEHQIRHASRCSPNFFRKACSEVMTSSQ